ncbi:uncharacterized protein LY89DRAFT_787482 [Mollisia scopiformis]|uniref:Uncharacterized protein n=1 Tax=Mollisia scopiformis TaxID=149040 RepID=A0A132BDK2_MOLSC|nr:uncharacterized protein LY89DRAFT_787482 [Mollisia scopiformis]KUJ10461.1 hypothetical protein LY89DRAFT_787482 [Mollisia scopiformis]
MFAPPPPTTPESVDMQLEAQLAQTMAEAAEREEKEKKKERRAAPGRERKLVNLTVTTNSSDAVGRSDRIRRKRPSIETLRRGHQQPSAFCVNAESRAVAIENHVKIPDGANAPNSKGATYVHKELDRV